MSIKLKLVSCISAFILVLGIFIFGVLSAEQATVNLGGSISFEATDVYARVTGRVQNAQTNPTLETLEFSAYNDTPDQSSWSGLELQFDSRATNITIEVTVENLSMERELTVNLTDMIETSTDNLGKSITLDNGAYVSGTNTTVPVATSSDSATNTSKVTFLITFDVIDHNSSLPSTDFDYDINLYDENYTPPPTSASSFTFSFDDTEHTATITRFIGSETEVVIPSTVNKLTDTTATEGSDYTVTTIGESAFYSCRSLTSVDFGDNSQLTSISFAAFDGCSSLTSITIPEGVTTIGERAFDECRSLKSVDFGDNSQLTSISSSAFRSCSSLTSITIPDSVTNIGSNAFIECFALAEIYNYSNLNIPEGSADSSVGYLGAYAKVVHNLNAEDTKPQTKIRVVDNMQYYEDGVDFIALAPTSIEVTEVILDSKTTEINVRAFSGLTGLETITIPEGVTSIGTSAFAFSDTSRYNSKLTTVRFVGNSKLITIGDFAFYTCRSLTSVDFGVNSQLISIGKEAFKHCRNLTSITIPSNVTSISSSAFENCNLTSVTIDSSYAYKVSGGGLTIWDNRLLGNANTVYIHETLVTELGLDANSFLNDYFSCNGTPVDGYYVFTRNQ